MGDTVPRTSAGLIMHRKTPAGLEVLLVHPGGPFWRNKDDGAWSIPKGEVGPGEDLLDTARREFQEELGLAADGPFLPLAPVKQKGAKIVHAWAFAGNCDPSQIRSNTFAVEWPPRSGKLQQFPEVDQAAFFDLATARRKINPAQIALLDELEKSLLKS
ncbi:MAG: NUDIX domain-containing protein [Thermoguttaceae bacterium]|nr:NUDIX domain-containing protein [Thermoguttaceae bacterium]